MAPSVVPSAWLVFVFVAIWVVMVDMEVDSFHVHPTVLRRDFPHRHRHYHHHYHPYTVGVVRMVRNIDLPEAVVFYGRECLFENECNDNTKTKSKRRVRKEWGPFLKDCRETDTCSILLTERGRGRGRDDLSAVEMEDDQAVSCVLSSQQLTNGLSGNDGQGHAPSPAALLDAIAAVTIQPKAFGGSSGFGSQLPDPERPPFAKHVVVMVTGPNDRSRARCTAARLAGMRLVYLVEGGGTDEPDDDGLADAVIPYDELPFLTVDDVATPGSYWLNPPLPRSDDGDRVDPEEVAMAYRDERQREQQPQPQTLTLTPSPSQDGILPTATATATTTMTTELSNDELERILADMDPL